MIVKMLSWFDVDKVYGNPQNRLNHGFPRLTMYDEASLSVKKV
jgi:hypothetical protein